MTEPAIALLQEMLAEVGVGWNVRTFGALAEFHHVAQDPSSLITLTRTGRDTVTAQKRRKPRSAPHEGR
jgi:hypothetical protein